MRFMTQLSLTSAAWSDRVREPQDRTVQIGGLIAKLGGSLVDSYYCFGEYDMVIIFDAPDDVTAAAIIVGAGVPGSFKATQTTRLFTGAEGAEIMRRAGKVFG